MKLVIGVFLVMAGVAGLASSSGRSSEPASAAPAILAQVSPGELIAAPAAPPKVADDAENRVPKPGDDSTQMQALSCDVLACDWNCTQHGWCAGECELTGKCFCVGAPPCP